MDLSTINDAYETDIENDNYMRNYKIDYYTILVSNNYLND